MFRPFSMRHFFVWWTFKVVLVVVESDVTQAYLIYQLRSPSKTTSKYLRVPPSPLSGKTSQFLKGSLNCCLNIEISAVFSFDRSPTCKFPCTLKLQIFCPSQCIAKGLLGCKHWPMTLHVCERCLKLLCLLSQQDPNENSNIVCQC